VSDIVRQRIVRSETRIRAWSRTAARPVSHNRHIEMMESCAEYVTKDELVEKDSVDSQEMSLRADRKYCKFTETLELTQHAALRNSSAG
jgi:hypothetical protein